MPGILSLLKPAMSLLPEVMEPNRKILKREKIVWTGITLFIYLVCCQIPIYGVKRSTGTDPFYWMRVILASHRGTLMELGISPLVTASMVMQVLTTARFVDVNMQVREDRALFNGAQKLLGIIIAVTEAFAYTWAGNYGSLEELGAGNAILILLQLTFSSVVVMILDDLMQKGYGLGSGISLFIATNICENIIWRSFSPVTITSTSGTEFEGSIINAVHLFLTKPSTTAFYQAFYRQTAPNLNNLIATITVFFVVIYFQGFKIDIPISSQKVRGHQSTYPIKLFYTSNIPIIMQSALISNIYFLSQILWRRYRENVFVRFLGQWQEIEYGGQSVPVGGLAYYLSPPRDLADVARDPLHTLVYTLFVCGACGLFARFWIEFSGESSKHVVKKLKDQFMIIKGSRDSSMFRVFDRYIPIAAFCGGVCIGLLTIIADFLGAIGSGTGILLSVTIIYGYFEQLKKENADSMMQEEQQ